MSKMDARKLADKIVYIGENVLAPISAGGIAGTASGIGVGTVRDVPEDKTIGQHLYDSSTIGASVGTGGAVGRLIGRALARKLIKNPAARVVGEGIGSYSGIASGAATGFIGGKHITDKRQKRRLKKREKELSEFEINEGSDMEDKEAVLGTILGTGIGAGVGALRETDEGESRIKSILRSALTGASTGIGVDVGSAVGGTVGGVGGSLPGIGVSTMAPETGRALAGVGGALGGTLGSVAGGLAGGYAGHRIAQRKDKQPEEQEQGVVEEKTAHSTTKMIGSMDGYVYKDAFLVPLVGNAALGTGIGATVGALRNKDEDETRGKAILRSAGTGLATGTGVATGSLLGSLPGRVAQSLAEKSTNPKLKAMATALRVLGAATGATTGGVSAYQMAKRRPEEAVEEKVAAYFNPKDYLSAATVGAAGGGLIGGFNPDEGESELKATGMGALRGAGTLMGAEAAKQLYDRPGTTMGDVVVPLAGALLSYQLLKKRKDESPDVAQVAG
jgi:hypothetical protein